MFNLFCTLPALPAAKPQPIPLRCMKVPPLPVTPNRAVVYARTADRHVGVLETQYNSVLAAAREDGCIVVDAAIEHCPGNSLKKPGLLRLLKLVRKGEANVLYVQDLSRLHGILPRQILASRSAQQRPKQEARQAAEDPQQ